MKIIIIGHGGHSKVISDVILSNEKDEIMGYLDDKYHNLNLNEDRIYGPIMSAKTIAESFNDIQFVIGIGDNKIRKMIVDRLDLPNELYATLVHKTALVSPFATIGAGTVIMPNTVINAYAQIGKHSIINTSAVVEHDCRVGDFVHISPNSTLTGAVNIKEGTMVGAGSVVIPNVIVEEWSIIGAGSTVINDIPSHCTAMGTPARHKINWW